MIYAAYLSHDAWDKPEFFLSLVSEEDAEAKAQARLLEHTEEYRDHDEYEADESWIDLCLSEDWSIETGEVQDTTDDTTKRNRRVALDYMARLVEEKMEEGQIPQPSSFGIVGENNEDEDPVYDWCQELIETIDTGEVK